MALEIERKFLVKNDKLPTLPMGTTIKQGYLPTQGLTVVRVRVKGNESYLTIKGANQGAVRSEYEYTIPINDANEMLANLCDGSFIDKTRYEIPFHGHTWELDIFHGNNEGLIVAEIELNDEDEEFECPEWLGQEVTGDTRYYNSQLLATPYNSW